MNAIKHLAVVILPLFLILGLPFLTSDAFVARISGVDTVTRATEIIDAPSGEYVFFINRDVHEKSGTLPTWTDFFSGEEIAIVFEDIDCIAGSGDQGGMDFAISLRSRLPENQMRIRTEEMTLMLSKVRAGHFDTAIMSKEAFEKSGADAASFDDSVIMGTNSK